MLASLRYTRRFGTRAVGDCGGQQWTFTWEGWLKPRIRVQASSRDADAAVVTLPLLGWRGGPWLERLADARPLEWAAADRLGLEYCLRGEGRELMRFTQPLLERQYHREGKREMSVVVTEPGRGLPELPMLVVLGRYLAR